MRWLLLLVLACDSAPPPPPADPCGALRARRVSLESEDRVCESNADCELVIVRPIKAHVPGRMGESPEEGECYGRGVAVGRAQAWTQLDDDLRAHDCVARSSGRCRLDQWEADCHEGQCSAHTTSGY